MNSPAMNTTQLEALLDRVKAASGPDEALAIQILEALDIASYIPDEGDPSASVDAAIWLAESVIAIEGRKLICFFCAGGQLTPFNADPGSMDYHPLAKIDNSVTAGWMAHVAFYDAIGSTRGPEGYFHGRTAPLAILGATLSALIKEPTP